MALTESYESLKEWNQDIGFSDFDQSNEWEKVPKKKKKGSFSM